MGQPRGEMLPYLKAWRRDRLLMQTELAEKSGISESMLSRLENLKQTASLKTVGKIADALGITRQQLLYEEPTPKDTPAAA